MLVCFWFPSSVLRILRCLKITEPFVKIYQKSVKMEIWGGSGSSWGSSWRHFGPNMAQSWKNLKKVTWRTPPGGAKGGHFWACFDTF